MATRVEVFIDYSNARQSARRAFGWEDYPGEHGRFSPFKLAVELARRNRRGSEGELCQVGVYRGLPSSERDPKGHGATQRQAAAWKRESPLVEVRLRPLRYPHGKSKEDAEEKGVDVELAIAVVEAVQNPTCDVAVLFTNDSDLLPAVEYAVRHGGTGCIETAAWRGEHSKQRLRSKSDVFHHNVDLTTFRRVVDTTNYLVPTKKRRRTN